MRSSLLSPTLFGCMLSCVTLAGCHHGDRCPTCGRPGLAAAPTSVNSAVAALPSSPYAAVTSGPIGHTVLKPTETPMSAPPVHSEWQNVTGMMREKNLERRTFTDVTANPAFAHAPDYSWLIGELRTLGPGVYAVRFASVDEDRDTVLLVDAPAIIGAQAGQLVRVEGQLVNAAASDTPPSYRVTSIRPFARD